VSSSRWAVAALGAFAAVAVIAGEGPPPVLSSLRVTQGSVEWFGFLLGMPKSAAERQIGHVLEPRRDPDLVGHKPTRVIIGSRAVDLYFSGPMGEEPKLIGFIVQRMGTEDPEAWSESRLTESVPKTVSDAADVEHLDLAGPRSRRSAAVEYGFPSAPAIKLLLKPDDDTIYLGFHDFFVD